MVSNGTKQCWSDDPAIKRCLNTLYLGSSCSHHLSCNYRLSHGHRLSCSHLSSFNSTPRACRCLIIIMRYAHALNTEGLKAGRVYALNRKYALNNQSTVWEKDCNACLKRKISYSRAVVWYAGRSYMLYSFWVMCDGKGRRTKSKFLCSFFSTVRRINGTLGVYFILE